MELKTLTPWISQSALSTSRAYRDWVSLPDVTGHLWQWAFTNEDRVDEYLARPEGERIVRSILNQEARNYAVKERAASSGHQPEDIMWYSRKRIKALLPDVFDYRDWQSAQQSGSDRRSSKPVNESGDRLAEIIDVSAAMQHLPSDRIELLQEFYSNGLSVEQVASLFGIEPDTARKRIDRAVASISNSLNDPRPTDPMEGVTYEQWLTNQRFYDTRGKFRKAVSNAAARKMTEGSYGD